MRLSLYTDGLWYRHLGTESSKIPPEIVRPGDVINTLGVEYGFNIIGDSVTFQIRDSSTTVRELAIDVSIDHDAWFERAKAPGKNWRELERDLPISFSSVLHL